MAVKGWRGTVASVYRVTRPSRLEPRRTECDSCHLEPAQAESRTVTGLQSHLIAYMIINLRSSTQITHTAKESSKVYLGVITQRLHLLLRLVLCEFGCFLHFLELLSKLRMMQKNVG